MSVHIKSGEAPVANAIIGVDLIDGSHLAAVDYQSKKGEATIYLRGEQELKLPTSSIVHVRLKEQSEKIAVQWRDVLAAPRAGDVIVIRRDEAIDYQEGVLGDVSAETVQFMLDGDRVNVKRPRVEGFLYFHKSAGELPAAVCQVKLHSGSRLQARSVTLRDGQLQVVTTAGVTIDVPLEQASELDFSLGKLRYVSDLDPERVEHTPYLHAAGSPPELDRYYEPRFDRSFDGELLQLGNQSYAKGIALKSRTTLTYRLPGKFSRFEAIAGIDAAVAPLGHVRLVIRGDEKSPPLFETEIDGNDSPKPISVDVSSLKRLVIEVDFGQGGDVADYLDLVEARIIQ
jgi:hypothetical protein